MQENTAVFAGCAKKLKEDVAVFTEQPLGRYGEERANDRVF